MSKVLSFDTSNYTTSACILDSELGIVWENRTMLPVREGMCGVRQNDAVFLHTQNLIKLFEGVPKTDPDYIAASLCPSERENSYMPCFTVGISFASALSSLLGKPLYTCSHQKNHIAAAAYSAGCAHILNDRFLAYHVSGGTTDILLCTPGVRVFDVTHIGGTADISCGQLIDRTGVMLGMSFPCGKSIEHYSSGNLSDNIKIANRDGSYNFSGFQNKTEKMHSDGCGAVEVCDYVLSTVLSFLKDSLSYFRGIYGNIPVIFSGGVMSNKYISQYLTEAFEDVYFSEPKYSVDNSLGTAFMCIKERNL